MKFMNKLLDDFEKEWLYKQLDNLDQQQEGRYDLTQRDIFEIYQLLLSLSELDDIYD